MSLHIKKRNKVRSQRARRTRSRVTGSAAQPRIHFFRSNRYNYAQAIDDVAGETLVAVSPADIKAPKNATKSDRAAALGEKMAEKLKEKGIEKASFDRGSYRYHGRVKAFAEALRKGGIHV